MSAAARVLLLSFVVACRAPSAVPASVQAAPPPEIEATTPEAEGMSSDELVRLTKWIRDNPIPIFSLLISRNGRLVYELYTSSIDRQDAHYVMSVTKSILSALIGIAIDRHLMSGPQAPITESLPRSLFAKDDEVSRFQPITLERIMGMAALDAPDPPRKTDAEAVARQKRFWSAPNRVAVALEQPLLKEVSFQYNDATPALAVGALQYSTGKTALEFGEDVLFGPLGFRNHEWMHQDAAGIDNGGFGLRLRPIDMQKLGILYLERGAWKGKQIVSKEWIDRSFHPWNRSRPEEPSPDYGWFWWTDTYGPGWTALLADGWKGQRIAVIPEQRMVITMTACIEDGTDHAFFTRVVKDVVMAAVRSGGRKPPAAKELAALLEEVHRGPSRLNDFIQYRMVPSATPKQRRRPFVRN